MLPYVVEKKEIYTNMVVVMAESIADALKKARDETGEITYERTMSNETWNVILNGEIVY